MDEQIQKISSLFSVLADPTRMSIIKCLLVKNLNVSEIANLIQVSPSAVSHQLRVLRLSNIVRHQKIGKSVSYELSDDHINILYEIAKEHVNE